MSGFFLSPNYTLNVSCNITSDDESGGFLDYARFINSYSQYDAWMPILACVGLLCSLFCLLSITADEFFCPNLGALTKLLRLNENIAGVTLLAFGNGAPDIFSSLASVLGQAKPKPGLAFGALLGSGLFLTSFVGGVVGLRSPSGVHRRPFLRDSAFFVAALAAVLAILLDGRIRLGETLGFLALYATYVLVVILGRFLRLRWRRQKSFVTSYLDEESIAPFSVSESLEPAQRRLPTSSSDEDFDDVWRPHPSLVQLLTTDSEDSGSGSADTSKSWIDRLWIELRSFSFSEWAEMSILLKVFVIVKSPISFVLRLTIPVAEGPWSQPLTVIQLFVAPSLLLIFTQKSGETVGGIPFIVFTLCFGGVLAGLVLATSSGVQAPRYHKALSLLGFLMSVLWIFGAAREVVGIVSVFGALLSVSDDLLGLTLLAWANSLGDLVSNSAVARSGRPRLALAACLAGPLFNLLVGFGLPFTLAAARSELPQVGFPPIRRLLLGFLGASILTSLVVVPASGFRVTRVLGGLLIGLYGSFLVCAIATERGWI